MSLLGIHPKTAQATAGRGAVLVVAAGVLACVLAAVPSRLFDLDRHAAPKELVLHVTAVLASALVLLRARELRLGRLDSVLAAWLAVGALSSLFTDNPWLALRCFSIATSGALVFWTVRSLSANGWKPQLHGALAAATAAAAATALMQAYGADLWLFAETRVPGGTFGNRNFMAHFVALGLPTLFLTGMTGRSRWARWGASAGLAAAAAALVLSRTRAAWLAVGVSCALSLLFLLRAGVLQGHPQFLRRALRLVTAAALGISAALALPNRLDWRSANPYLESALGVVEYRKGSGKGRLVQYRNTLGMLEDHPALGVGPGNWVVHYPQYAGRRDPSLGASSPMPTNPWPSSDWVGFLVEWGPAGLGLLAAVVGGLWVHAWRRTAPGRDFEDRMEGVALAATASALVVVGAVDAVLRLAPPTLLFWSAAGALAPPSSAWKTFRPAWAARAALVLAILVAGGAAAARSAGQAAAISVAGSGWRLQDLERASRLDPGNYRLHMLLAEGWARRGRCDRSLPHARSAERLFPYLPEPRRVAASCGKP